MIPLVFLGVIVSLFFVVLAMIFQDDFTLFELFSKITEVCLLITIVILAWWALTL